MKKSSVGEAAVDLSAAAAAAAAAAAEGRLAVGRRHPRRRRRRRRRRVPLRVPRRRRVHDGDGGEVGRRGLGRDHDLAAPQEVLLGGRLLQMGGWGFESLLRSPSVICVQKQVTKLLDFVNFALIGQAS